MDAARCAGMSDPDNNPNFRRRWDAPPLKVKRAPLGGTSGRPEFENVSNNLDVAWIFERFKILSEIAG